MLVIRWHRRGFRLFWRRKSGGVPIGRPRISVVTEILKSWWHRAPPTHLYDYRDRDKREVDLLIEHAGRLHPLDSEHLAIPVGMI